MLLAKSIGKTKAKALAADPVLFVRAFAPDLDPWPYQADILRQVTERDETGKFRKRIAVISTPRQNGKTTLSAMLALWRLFTEEDQEIVTVACDFEQARLLLRDGRRIIHGSGILHGLLAETGQRYSELTLVNGSRWIVKSSDSVSSRGLRPSMVCYDELGWATDRELFDVLSASQAAQDNPLSVITSTVGPVQAGVLWELFELARADDPAIRLIYHTENLSPRITEEFLEKQRAILPAGIYAREHQNTWGSGSDLFCTLADWQRAIDDGSPLRSTDPGPCFAFLDLGWIHDESALAIGRREDEKIAIIHLETWQGSQDSPVSFAAIEDRIIELAPKLNIKKLVIESPQGVAMQQRIDGAGLATETLHPTAKSNRENWGSLYTALKNGTIRLPDDAKLRRQLLTLTIKSGPTGWKVVDVPSIHQDRAVAIAGVSTLCEQRNQPFGVTVKVPAHHYKTNRDAWKRKRRLALIRH